MPQKKPKEEPAQYFPKINREYHMEELRYIQSHIFRRKRRVLPQRSPKAVQAANLLDQIRQGWSKESGLGPFEEEKDKYVIEAIKLFSGTAFSVGVFPFRLSDEGNKLGGSICRVLGYLRQQALMGTKEARQSAIKRLKNIMKDVIPGGRGKRGDKIDSGAVKFFYYQEMFRLHQIRNALKSPLGAINQSQKVKDVGSNFGVPIGTIRQLWFLDENDKPKSRRVSLKEMARILTANHFCTPHHRMTQHRVSNILAL